MTQLAIFNELMRIAKNNGYRGEDYKYEKGRITHLTNYYSLIFDKDFMRFLFIHNVEAEEVLNKHLVNMVLCDNKWKYIEENII